MAKTKVRRRPDPVQESGDAVTRGLQAIGREEADRVLHGAGYNDKAMLEAVRAQNRVLYAVACGELGLDNTQKAREVFAKNEMILLQLAHNAAAMAAQAERGKNGRERP